MDVLGDAVMKHVCCRVTVDGPLPEASPVEAVLIQTRSIIHTMEHANTREGQSTCNLGLLKINQSVALGLHREAQGASLSAFPVGGMTRACFMSSPLPLDVCKHTFFFTQSTPHNWLKALCLWVCPAISHGWRRLCREIAYWFCVLTG